MGVQKYDNVWRTRSAQPVYGHHHGGDGNEDYYGRTKNELRKNINTNLNISKIADNRILRINIDQHHENNELTENYEKSHLDKICNILCVHIVNTTILSPYTTTQIKSFM